MITTNRNTTDSPVNKAMPVLQKNFHNNLETDYTEKIQELDKNFNYRDHSGAYWSEPEHSLLYGTPLYQQASQEQKLALNHLHWALFYKLTGDSETELIHYNTVTADCLMSVSSDYKMLVDLLAHETYQERKHTHAFYQVYYKTTKSLLGKKALLNSGSENAVAGGSKNLEIADYISSAANLISKMMLKNQGQSRSQNSGQVTDVDKPASFISNGFFNGLSGKSSLSRRQLFSNH